LGDLRISIDTLKFIHTPHCSTTELDEGLYRYFFTTAGSKYITDIQYEYTNWEKIPIRNQCNKTTLKCRCAEVSFTLKSRLGRGAEDNPTNKRNQFLVLSGVLTCLLDFIDKKSPDIIYFRGDRKHSKTYTHVEPILQRKGYSLETTYTGDASEFTFYKKKSTGGKGLQVVIRHSLH